MSEDGPRPPPRPAASETPEELTRPLGAVTLPKEAFRDDRPDTGLRAMDVLGSYQILRRLGGGGMADVYLARATLAQGVDRLVAFKTARREYGPDTRFGTFFLTEAKVSATLQHPNVVQVFDFGEAAGRLYLAMEYVHGRELTAVLKKVREGLPLPVSFLVAVLADVCRALEHVHAKKGLDGAPLNLVHRDVSPSNILITAAGDVKLTDFGVAAGEEAGGSDLVVGKAAYIPEEQALGGRPRPDWDVYAVGAVLQQFLAASRSGPSPAAGAVEAVSLLEQIASRARCADPALRFESAHALRQALEALQARLEPADPGGTVKALFGAALEEEERENAALFQKAREARPAFRVPGPLRLFVALRRRVASTRWAMWLAAHRALGRTVGALAIIALAFAGAGLWAKRRAELLFTQRIADIDAQIAAGRLVGAGGDQALDLLLRVQGERPGDVRVAARLEAVAAAFERLADAALARGDQAEAVAQFQAVLKADPGRASAAEKLRQIEEAVREQSRTRHSRRVDP